MHLVRAPIPLPAVLKPAIALRVERSQLAKRLWRGTADDGADFGFELESTLKHLDVIWETPTCFYRVQQKPEAVLEIPLDVSVDAAAVIGWAIGNLHFVIETQPGRLLAPDDSALRTTLDRLGIHFHVSEEIFQPHRFSGSLVGHGHGHGH